MKQHVLFIRLMVVLLFLTITSPLVAQENTDEKALALGAEISGTFVKGDKFQYTLNIKDAGESVDIVLFSTDNGTLVIADEQGTPIRTVERMDGYGFEVFTWNPGDKVPGQIIVLFGRSDGDYKVSVVPSEQQSSEQPRSGEQVRRWDEVEVGKVGSTKNMTIPYLLYVPKDYDENKKYPFILFMHGFGETGPRLDFLKNQVIPKLIEDGQDFPFIIASPHLDYGQVWGEKVDMIASFVEHLQSEFPIDPDRIYITGLSLGGWGAWSYALAHPDVPAAVVSMSGWYNWGSSSAPRNICDLTKVPMWVVHGEQDKVIDIAWEKGLVDALKECGGNVQFTAYPDADHTMTFERGFADPALYEWLLEQHK